MQSEYLRLIEEEYLRRFGQIADTRPDKGAMEWVVRDVAIVATVLDFLSKPMLASKLANAREFDERLAASKAGMQN